jgi:hypothetical protein
MQKQLNLEDDSRGESDAEIAKQEDCAQLYLKPGAGSFSSQGPSWSSDMR